MNTQAAEKIKSIFDTVGNAAEAQKNELISEIEQALEAESSNDDAIEEDSLTEESLSTDQVINRLESSSDILSFQGIKKVRAIRQKIELKSMDGQSLKVLMPEISDRALFRAIFQILFQAQRVKEELVSFVSDKEIQVVLNDLNDVLITGLESLRLSADQKILLKALMEEIETLNTEFKKPLLEQSTDKIKSFEKKLEEQIQMIEGWVEPFTRLFL
jgi:Zn-dependent oligopeptidase